MQTAELFLRSGDSKAATVSLLSTGSFEQVFDLPSEVTITSQVLVDRSRAVGADVTVEDVETALRTHRLRADEVALQSWRQLLALQVGDARVKAAEAFRLIDQDKDGRVELSALKRLIQLFEVTEGTAEAITIEMARDGSASIDLERFRSCCGVLPR